MSLFLSEGCSQVDKISGLDQIFILLHLMVQIGPTHFSRSHTNTNFTFQELIVRNFKSLVSLMLSIGLVTAICPTMEVHCHDITSVGVGFSPSGRMLGSGDLVGTVWVSEKDAVSPLHKCSVSYNNYCVVQGNSVVSSFLSELPL